MVPSNSASEKFSSDTVPSVRESPSKSHVPFSKKSELLVELSGQPLNTFKRIPLVMEAQNVSIFQNIVEIHNFCFGNSGKRSGTYKNLSSYSLSISPSSSRNSREFLAILINMLSLDK